MRKCNAGLQWAIAQRPHIVHLSLYTCRAATVLRDPGTEPIAGAIVITTSRTP